ncbi:MAG: hypothetical protein KDN22_33455 [Verrucomicrobiae bacterium]|nr:hypothetical protein [Verrucomicrobiae bacterium]
MKFSQIIPLAFFCFGTLTNAGELTTPVNMSAVRDLVVPSAEEVTWLNDIPWETDLSDALAKAKAAGRPVFLWEMDGHPLGCT